MGYIIEQGHLAKDPEQHTKYEGTPQEAPFWTAIVLTNTSRLNKQTGEWVTVGKQSFRVYLPPRLGPAVMAQHRKGDLVQFAGQTSYEDTTVRGTPYHTINVNADCFGAGTKPMKNGQAGQDDDEPALGWMDDPDTEGDPR